MYNRRRDKELARARTAREWRVAEEQEERRAEVDLQVRSVIGGRGHQLSRVNNRPHATYRCTVCGGLVGIYQGKEPVVRVAACLDQECRPDLACSKEVVTRDLREFVP